VHEPASDPPPDVSRQEGYMHDAARVPGDDSDVDARFSWKVE
jgi:hypothetical protein